MFCGRKSHKLSLKSEIEPWPSEKYRLIEYFNDIRLLIKKSEFISACRPQSKLLLKTLEEMIAWLERMLTKLAKKYFCIFVNLMYIFVIFRTK